MATYPSPHPPMCKVEIYCPEGQLKVGWTELYNNVLAFQCEKFLENPAGSWYMVLKDTRLRASDLKQRITSKHVIKVWLGRVDGGGPMRDDHLAWLGIVDGVAENEHVSAKSNYTELVITGRCLGGVLIDMPVFFQGWGEGFDKWWWVSTIMNTDDPAYLASLMVDDFVHKTRECNTAWGPGGGNWIRKNFTETGLHSFVARPQHGASAWSTIEQVMVRPWTETFIEVAGPNAGQLTYRIKPWNGLAPMIPDASNNVANPPGVNPPSAQGRYIRAENFIAQKTHISDEDYFNHIMTQPANSIMIQSQDIDNWRIEQNGGTSQQSAPGTTNTDDPSAPGGGCVIRECAELNKRPGEIGQVGMHENRACQSRYGVKSMRLQYNMGYPVANHQRVEIVVEDLQRIADDLYRWYNRPFERAEITVRGDIYYLGTYILDEHVHGGQIGLSTGSGPIWTKYWYIEGVSQEYVYGDHWYTTLHISEARPRPHNRGWGLEFCAGFSGTTPTGERGTFTAVTRL